MARRPNSSTSSITKASARPDSTMPKASAWSLASTTFQPMAPVSSILRSMASGVVPVVDTTVLPRRSARLRMPESVFTSMRLPAM